MRGKLIFGAAVGSAALAATVGVRRARTWSRTLGVDAWEAAAASAGDDLVPDAASVDTRGITIEAAPEVVSPGSSRVMTPRQVTGIRGRVEATAARR